MTVAYDSRNVEHLEFGSDRGFGFTMATAFSIGCGVSFWMGADSIVSVLAAVVALGFLLLATTKSSYLTRPKILWAKFGYFLAKITNPVVLGLLYYLVICPISIVLKVVGFDPLHRRRDEGLETYWVDREKQLQDHYSMKNQF